MNIRIAPIIPALLVAAIGFSAPTLTSSSRRMYTPDPHSLDIVDDDDGIPRMEVRGFTTPTAARTGYNFADILTNRNVNVSNLKVLLRDGTDDNRELKYADLAKIVGYSGGGGHGVDNLSVTTNSDNNATLVGFSTAREWDIAYVSDENGKNKLAWRRMDDDDTITTRSASGALSEGSFSLYGFSGADDFAFPYKKENATLGWGLFDDNSFDWDGEYLSLKDIYANDGKVLYSNNGQVGWGIIDADEMSIHVEDNSKTWTFSLYDYPPASTGHIPFKGGTDLDWGGIVGDQYTVDFSGLSDGLDSIIRLHGADDSINGDKYAYLDNSGELQWIDPTDGCSTELDNEMSLNGYNLIKLYGFDYDPSSEGLPYNSNGTLSWHQASTSSTNYLAEYNGGFHWVNNPQRGPPGKDGADGKDGTDGNPGEWFTNHVADIVQLLVGTSNFVTSVNGETGDVALKKLTIYSWKDHNVVVSEYNGSADVDVDCTEAYAADSAMNASNASYAEFADRAFEADYAGRASVAGDADYASRAAYAEIAGEIGPPPNSLQLSAPLAKSAAPSTNAVRSAGSASPSGLSFSANGSVLTITDGTHTWKLDAQ